MTVSLCALFLHVLSYFNHSFRPTSKRKMDDVTNNINIDDVTDNIIIDDISNNINIDDDSIPPESDM